jgi:hypothetical protein
MKQALSYKQEFYYSKKVYGIEYNHFETTILLLPNELFKNILSFCGIVEYHVLRLVCKYTHDWVHDYNALFIKSRNSKRYFFNEKKYDLLLSVMKEIDISVLIWIEELFPVIFSPNFADYCKCAAKVGRASAARSASFGYLIFGQKKELSLG